MTRRRANLQAVDNTSASAEQTPPSEPKPKRQRKARTATSFADDLRALAGEHRKRLGYLIDAEAKLEASLAEVRRQREAAEGPLREVEAMLANHPALPLEPSAQPSTDQPADVDAGGEAVSP